MQYWSVRALGGLCISRIPLQFLKIDLHVYQYLTLVLAEALFLSCRNWRGSNIPTVRTVFGRLMKRYLTSALREATPKLEYSHQMV